MDISKVINNPELAGIIKSLHGHCDDKHFSDIVDAEGHQYVDLVMEGGGMLGVALVGYIYALEQIGLRFLGLGGTSAGSINALLLAAMGSPAAAKSNSLLEELFSKNFADFIDGDSDARDFINTALDPKQKFKKIKTGFKALQIIDNLEEDLGLNPGDHFVEWLSAILRKSGIATLADLQAQMQTLPAGLTHRHGAPLGDPARLFRLALIAADISTETKAEFPRMAGLYWKNPQSINPALFVRASMSIPYFFQPLTVRNIPAGTAAIQQWEQLAGYDIQAEKRLPKTVLFIDGGIVSNFPIDVFHNPGAIPRVPTFGVKLELDKRLRVVDGPLSLFTAMFNSARHALDFQFIFNNPDYKRLVTWIPAEGYNWLDFNMSDPVKTRLFIEGARCAQQFLQKFDWNDYKKLRESLIAARTMP